MFSLNFDGLRLSACIPIYISLGQDGRHYSMAQENQTGLVNHRLGFFAGVRVGGGGVLLLM